MACAVVGMEIVCQFTIGGSPGLEALPLVQGYQKQGNYSPTTKIRQETESK